MTDVRPSTPDDADLIARVAAAGFFDDPLMSWVFPDVGTRPAKLLVVFGGLAADMVSDDGHAFLADDRCAALWRSPDFTHFEDGDGDEGRDGPPSPFTSAELERLAHLQEGMQANHPHEPHWYLNVLATRPESQGQGLGAAALQPVLDRCDADGVRAYLESSNPRNLTLYRRHGFVEAGEIRMPDGPSLTQMWRDPR